MMTDAYDIDIFVQNLFVNNYSYIKPHPAPQFRQIQTPLTYYMLILDFHIVCHSGGVGGGLPMPEFSANLGNAIKLLILLVLIVPKQYCENR